MEQKIKTVGKQTPEKQGETVEVLTASIQETNVVEDIFGNKGDKTPNKRIVNTTGEVIKSPSDTTIYAPALKTPYAQ